ncbi:MAG TPA: LysM peptidoglycan-binding domain-containing protein [Tissierellaceae bacterium]|nr:LysM peptidoglycan-binding domain-containing protein [Tissierellaceae bacterium]
MSNNHCGPGTTSYVIRSGDTFFNLASRFNTTVDAIMRANPGVDPNRLFIGQVICIPTSTPPTQPCPTLRLGSRGASVTELQRRLLSFGFNPGPIDGIFGSQTQAAVISFQRSRNLVADGVVGVQTWTALGVNCGTTPPPTTCPTGSQPYTIRSGDTLFNLANRFNTTVDAIIRINPGINPNDLQIGQVICIPTTAPPTTCPAGSQPYTIRSGDTLFNLANRFNTTVEAIMRVNPGINPNNLQIGQVICIPR